MYSVLLVDDEPHIIEALTLTVDWMKYGFAVADTASNALEALRLFEERSFDLIFADIHMPQMNGLEFIERIRKKNADTEIIIISGYNKFEYAKAAIKLKVDSYILKPIDPQEVSAQLLQLKAKLDAKRALEHPEEEMAENDTISEVIRYVDENFRKNISLKSISAHFYMNTSYLGQKFKNVVGECFNDYLNKKRIAYVKRHCHSKHAKMNEIISESGFSNHQYFYKQFQRYEGITFASYISKLNNCDDP